MPRKFRTANYEETLELKISLREALPPSHLVRFVVDMIAQLDISPIYNRYAPQGGEAVAPEMLLGLLFYGYATGLFNSRKIEKATYKSIPLHFIAGNLHPDNDTIANFRKTFLVEIKDLFVQILLLAQVAGVHKLGNISLDGSKIHVDTSKSHTVSYKRLIELKLKLYQFNCIILSTSHSGFNSRVVKSFFSSRKRTILWKNDNGQNKPCNPFENWSVRAVGQKLEHLCRGWPDVDWMCDPAPFGTEGKDNLCREAKVRTRPANGGVIVKLDKRSTPSAEKRGLLCKAPLGGGSENHPYSRTPLRNLILSSL